METPSSFFRLMDGMRDGDSLAEAAVYNRYVTGLLRIAADRMAPRFGARLDPDDIVQSVFRSFYDRTEKGQFEFHDWDSLWALLVAITVRKCRRKVRDHSAQIRDVGRERAIEQMSDLEIGHWGASAEPNPEEAAVLEDLLRTLMDGLEEQQQDILALRLQDFGIEEIAERVECSERTVYRILKQIRSHLKRLYDVERE